MENLDALAMTSSLVYPVLNANRAFSEMNKDFAWRGVFVSKMAATRIAMVTELVCLLMDKRFVNVILASPTTVFPNVADVQTPLWIIQVSVEKGAPGFLKATITNAMSCPLTYHEFCSVTKLRTRGDRRKEITACELSFNKIMEF